MYVITRTTAVFVCSLRFSVSSKISTIIHIATAIAFSWLFICFSGRSSCRYGLCLNYFFLTSIIRPKSFFDRFCLLLCLLELELIFIWQVICIFVSISFFYHHLVKVRSISQKYISKQSVIFIIISLCLVFLYPYTLSI